MVNLNRIMHLRNVLNLEHDIEALEKAAPEGTFEKAIWVELRMALDARRAYVRQYYDVEQKDYDDYLVRVGAVIDWDEVPE